MDPTTSRASRMAFMLIGLVAAACRRGDGDDGIGPEVPGDPEAGEFAAMALSAEFDAIMQHILLPSGAPSCITVAPFPPTDTDHDQVPDDATFTFDLDGCKFTWDQSGSWGSSSGAVRVTDPGAAFGLDAVVQAMTAWTHLADHTPPWTISREHTGTLHVAGSPAQVTFTVDQTLVFQVTGEPDAVLTMQWTGTFVPDGSNPFHFIGLNAGTLTLTGVSTFTRNQSAIQFSLSTPTPLIWQVSCDSPWAQSGVVRANVVSGATPGYLEITYSACWQTGDVEFIPS